MLAKLEEVLWSHGLDNRDLGHHDPLDGMGSLEQMLRLVCVVIEHEIPDALELEQQLLEPQLVDLVHGDEQQLVVGRRLAEQVLQREQLGNLQIAAVGELAILLSEARRARL